MPPVHAFAGSPPVAIARVITRLNIGGPARQAIGLSTALTADGFETTLFHGRLGLGEGDMADTISPTVRAVYLPTLQRAISPLDDVRTLLILYRAFRRQRPRIVHTHMAKAGLLARVAATAHNWTRGSAPRARIVHTYHGHVLEGYFSDFMSRVFVTLERVLAKCSDRLIAISPEIERELIDRYRIGVRDQYRVVPLGFDLGALAAIDDARRASARAALGIPAGVPVVATVGRLTAIKQPHVFLDTVAQLSTRHPTIIALVAGDGELRGELERDAARIGVADRVMWLGWRRDLDVVYGATDVFLLTSRNEGTPVALIEAMAAAVPGVSTDVGGVKDVIASPGLGTIVARDDVAALADATHRLLIDEARRRTIGAHARESVLERYSRERLVTDIVRLYRELLEER
jgi:glycosyltransferase involved in cell wall biosynthesis